MEEQPVKRKRGRPRKVKLPEEVLSIVNITNEVRKKEQDEFHLVVEEVKKEHKKGKWDVPIDQDIPYFDATLSYELTGYKPIDGTHGLDFDPNLFMSARLNWLKTQHYCLYAPNSKLYDDFWHEEYVRCRDGLTINGYTLTGDNYFFLNYYRLEDLTSAVKAGGGKTYSFPGFFVALYEYFHYIELCKKLRKDAIGLKARGVGFSEIAAAIVVNTYSCRRNTLCTIAAQLENYVSKTLSKCWYLLNFLNNNTDGGFFKLRQKLDTTLKKRASVVKIINGLPIEDPEGWNSEIDGIVADKPNKVRGDRMDILLYEESGSWPDWKKAYLLGQALVEIQGSKSGIRMAWGTGGDKGPALEGLADAYENPETYKALPFKHNFTPTGDTVISAYFIPAYAILNVPGYIDNRGWCDPVKSKKYYEEEREKKKDPEAYIIYCAEYCFNADEALALEGTNKFNKVLIANLITNIKVLHMGTPVVSGFLLAQYKNNSSTKPSNISGFKWIKGNGFTHIIEPPIWETSQINDEGNKVSYNEMRNLYVAGIDSIDIGADLTSAATKNPSKFCITIKKRAFGLEPPKYVAYYMDRPGDERLAYKEAMKLLMWYNCMANIEATRVSMLTWARDNHLSQFFMKRPRATYTDPNRKVSTTIGTPATKTVISHQTDLIANYVEDYCLEIWFPDMLDQLNRYTDENKGKFDIIAAMGMTELADEELSGIIPTNIKPEADTEWLDIGYYKDEYGHMKYGIIPKLKPINYTITNEYRTRNRTSDPRYL